MNIWFNDRLGFGKVVYLNVYLPKLTVSQTIVLGAVCQLLAYVFIIPDFPFPVFVSANFVAGFGLSLQVVIIYESYKRLILDRLLNVMVMWEAC